MAHSLHGSVPHERLCPDYFVIIIVWVSSSQASLWYRMNRMSAGKTTWFLLHLKFCQNNMAAGQQKGESGWLSPAPPLVIRTYFNAKFSSDLKTNPLKIQYSWLTFVNFQRLVKSTPLMGVAEKGAGTAFGHQEIWHSSGYPWHLSPPLHALLTLRCYLMEFYWRLWRPLTYHHYVPLSWAMQNMLTLQHQSTLTLLMVLSSLEFQPCNKTMEIGGVECSLQGFWKLKFPYN